jgi:hypothetical protein
MLLNFLSIVEVFYEFIKIPHMGKTLKIKRIITPVGSIHSDRRVFGR